MPVGGATVTTSLLSKQVNVIKILQNVLTVAYFVHDQRAGQALLQLRMMIGLLR